MTSDSPDPTRADTDPPAAPPEWAWAKPVAAPQWRETPPLEFHELMRGAPRYRWWKPLLALVLAALYYFTLSTVYGLAILLPYMMLTGDGLDAPDALLELALPDTQRPVSILLTLGSVALMIPAAVLAMLSVGLTPAKRLWSVALRIRWRWIGRTIVPALVSLIAMNVVGIALEFAVQPGAAQEAAAQPAEYNLQFALISMLLVLLLVPIQATAEELVYRGMFMQVLGGWLGGVRGAGRLATALRGPWIPIVLPAILFGFSHIYDIWGWASVVALAVVAGWLSWRTGGLEAAITMHVLNNLIAFGFLALAFDGETGQTSSGGGLGTLIGSIAGLALYSWWVDRDFRRTDGMRTRIDLVEAR